MNRSILIIEDEAPIADTLIFSLEKEGFKVFWESEGLKALELFQKIKIDFIILDLGLPDIDGFELLKIIRKQTQVPVLILSARSEDIDKIVGLEVGADDFVSKPFSPREITARIRAIQRRYIEYPDREQNASAIIDSNNSDTESQENLDILPFIVDDQKKIIFYHGQELLLSRYEYDILKLLIRRPGWVFSREQIMDMVWEEPEESFDRVVDTHIKNIRAKLKQINNSENPIITRRGIGYSLKEWKLQ